MKIVDFGTSIAYDPSKGKLNTKLGIFLFHQILILIIGTPYYIAPEVLGKIELFSSNFSNTFSFF